MNTEEILALYNIQMLNSVGEGRINEKMFKGGGKMASYFDVENRSVDWINEEILPLLEHFINGNTPPMDPNYAQLGGIGSMAYPYKDAVRFHNPINGEIVQTIPLAHFKLIAEAWRDFLSNPQHTRDSSES